MGDRFTAIWEYVHKSGKSSLSLTFDEIERISGIPIDHSFLNCKKELLNYGYRVEKISLKARTVLFVQNT